MISRSPVRRALHVWIRRRYALLVIAIVGGGAAGLAGRHLDMDRSLENMFSADDPVLGPYRQLQRTFGRHDIVMLVYADPALSTSAGLDRLRTTAEQVRGVPGVAAVVTLIDLPGATEFAEEGRGARFRDVFSGYTHNDDLDSVGILCLIERRETTDSARRQSFAELRAIAEKLPGAVVGEPVLVEEAFDLLEADGRRLNTWCTALVLVTIWACFGGLRWLLLPLAVVQLTLAATRGVLALSGIQLSMVSSMLAAIVTVIGVATVVHIIVRYLDARRRRLGRRAALEQTFAQLAAPVAFACLTDAAGFASLMVSEVGPVQDFGLMMALGSLLVLPSCLLLTPALTLVDGAAPAAERGGDRALNRQLVGALQWSQRHSTALLGCGIVVAAGAAWGAQRLERETDFVKNFRRDSPLVQAYSFVETQFGGAGVWDLMIPAPDSLQQDYLQRVLKWERRLQRRAPDLAKAISLADALDAGAGGFDQMPVGGAAADVAVRAGLGVVRAKMTEFIEAIYHVDPQDGRRWLRILLRSPEQLPAKEKTELIAQVQQAAVEFDPEAKATG
ncbi:MAG: MMPL family transporter, partial [Planctomycetota bacterium]